MPKKTKKTSKKKTKSETEDSCFTCLFYREYIYGKDDYCKRHKERISSLRKKRFFPNGIAICGKYVAKKG